MQDHGKRREQGEGDQDPGAVGSAPKLRDADQRQASGEPASPGRGVEG